VQKLSITKHNGLRVCKKLS